MRGRVLFEFGPFRLDTQERLLSTDGKAVALTPKVFDLLVLLARHPGQLLEKEWLLSTLWPETFVEEANLSVNISILRKALEAAGGERYIETVSKRGYRFTADVREIVTAVKKPVRWLRLTLLGALALGLLILAFERLYVHSIDSPSEIRSLAVLPFRPLASDSSAPNSADEAQLGMGMADAVVRELSSVQKIKVRDIASVQKYYAAKMDAGAAGRELQVDGVLEGRMQRSGNLIRVSVRLVRVSDGAFIWADRFDDYYKNIFQVQDSISEKVAHALKIKLTQTDHLKMAKHGTTNTQAYQLYLKGEYCEMHRTPDSLAKECIAQYEAAAAKDPDYALAYAGIARVTMELAGIQGQIDAVKKGRVAAERAIAIDESLAEAHLALGNVMFRGDWDWLGAQKEFARGLALDDNSPMAHWYTSLLLMAMGNREQALAEMQKAQLLNPMSQNLRDDLGWAYYCNRRFAEAIRESKIAVAMDSRSYAAHHQLGKSYLHAKEYSQAQAEFEATLKLNMDRRGFADLGQLLALTGKAAEAKRVFTELEQSSDKSKGYETAYMLAVLAGSLGEKDAGFENLEQAVAQKLSRAIWMRVDPDLDPLRSDARMDALLRRVNLVNDF